MSATHDQADTRKDVAPRGQPAGVNMSFNVIDANERYAERQGQHFRAADADEQGTDQARRVMHRHAADLVQPYVGLFECLVDDGKKALQMSPGGYLWNNPAETGMQIGLGSDDTRQHD